LSSGLVWPSSCRSSLSAFQHSIRLVGLLIGDYLFVSKYAYGYSRYSFPSGKYLLGRVWAAEPCSDVVVFKLPRDSKTDYIKRVIRLLAAIK
jgi:signal peptidase I